MGNTLCYWSINSPTIIDLILLSLEKMNSIDIEGRKKMANEIYSNLQNFRYVCFFFFFNKAAGYSLPPNLIHKTTYIPEAIMQC